HGLGREVGKGSEIEAVAFLDLVYFPYQFVSTVSVRGSREYAKVSAVNEMAGHGKAVLVEKAAQKVREMPLFMESEVACVLSMEIEEIGFRVVVVFVEVEDEGIIRRAVAEKGVRIEGK